MNILRVWILTFYISGIFQTVSPFGWQFYSRTTTTANKANADSNRRDFLLKGSGLGFTTIGITTIATITSNPEKAYSRNLPESTGADLSATGTIPKLIPILRIRSSLVQAQNVLNNQWKNGSQEQLLDRATLDEIIACLSGIPKDEKQFKQLFDEYSDPVSYKQKYMDSNAFLVYYTKGYDGPGRDSIEKDTPRQTLQYGTRNDTWNSYDELLVEMKFADSSSTIKDVLTPLNASIKNIDSYLNLAPKDDLEAAKMSLEKSHIS